jgi:NAD(P)H dehydrogenase (quinone)
MSIMIVVTAATGKLGRHVIDGLLRKVAAEDICAAVRHPEKAADLVPRGVHVRRGDYDHPETLDWAFKNAKKILLISSNEVGRRIAQHRAVVDAAHKAGAKLLAYTSILHCDTTKMDLAAEHEATELYIREVGVPHTFLRNGWYTENYTENLAPALQQGIIAGCADAGRIAAATRADYAEAAVAVLTSAGHENKVYELAGDTPFTMSELAAEVSRQSGKTIVYRDMPVDEYEKLLVGAGFPPPVAHLLADADLGVARGELDDSSGELRRLIGRPTTPLAAAVAAVLPRLMQKAAAAAPATQRS